MMMRKLAFTIFLGLLVFHSTAQRKPMESALLIGYQRYFNDSSMGFLNLGYSGFFEHESLYHFTKRSRFNASALINPFTNVYSLQVGGSYSYVATGGVNMNLMRQLPLGDRLWRINVNPFVGIDIWVFSFHIGYNLQIELQYPGAPDPPPLGKLNYSLNAYWPLKRNKNMYR